MNRVPAAVILLALATRSGSALAGDSGPRLGNPQPAIALGIGGTAALSRVGSMDLSGAGLHGEALARIFPETMGGVEADAVLVGSGDVSGSAARALRVGAKLRHSVFGWGDEKIGGELAVVAGFGWEQIAWNSGGRLSRTQLVIGLEEGVAVNRRTGGRTRYGSLSWGARGIFSRADGPSSGGWQAGVMFDVIVRGSP